MKILIVDDNAENLEMMSIILASQNYEVDMAANGQEALSKLQSGQYSLIISDILMPVMDGFQLCMECKKDNRLKDIGFVFYTATYVDSKDEEFALSLGALKFVRKPQEPEVFLKTIGELINNSAETHPEIIPHADYDEKEVLKLYSERLVNKLEKRNHDLEEEIDLRKKAESKLRESEERFALAVEGAADGLWDWDLTTDFLFFSEQNARMLGYEPSELPYAKESWSKLLHPADYGQAIQKINNYLKKKTENYESSYRMKAKDGSYRWVNARGKALFDSNGKAYRFVGFHTDITEKKHQEAELIKAKEKAEESDKLKTAFLANLSHEIRTPMNGILGFTNLLADEGLTPEEKNSFIAMVNESGGRLLSIIDDLIEISKLETKQVTINNDIFNLAELLDSVFEEMNSQIKPNHNLMLVKGRANLGANPVIISDKIKLYQILANLITNAIKYTPEGVIEYGCDLLDSGYIRFYVKDTGIGIHPEKHHIIFERFRQVENIEPVFQSGSGLGLSIAKSYVELLGGQIGLESEQGKGSLFFFTLPYKPVKNGNCHFEVIISKKYTDFTNNTILVAEDDDGNYAFLNEVLTRKNARVIRASNGMQATEICRSHPEIDLVLMDIRMPLLNGYEATEQIREFRKDLPIIAQTAFTYSEDKERALNAGCVDFIPKPLKSDSLLEIVDKYLR